MGFRHAFQNVAGCFALVTFVAGCETTTESAETAASRAEFRSEFPDNLYEVAFANAMAFQIAQNCPLLTLNRPQIENDLRAVSDDLEAKGYLESDIRFLEENLPRKRIEGDAIRFVETSGIVVGIPQTFCSAGNKEIAKSSAIGTFLKRVS